MAVKTDAIGKSWDPASFEVEAARIDQYATAVGEESPIHHDPEVGINLPTMVHGGQEFEWGEPVCAGDVITTTATCKEIYEQDGKAFYVFESVSTNQEGEETVRGTWTDIVRGVSE